MQYLSSDERECFDISEEYDKETAYQIVVIRYAIKGNRFSKYKTTTIAQDVSDATVAYMNEHSDTLTGVSIEEDTIRKYNDAEYFETHTGDDFYRFDLVMGGRDIEVDVNTNGEVTPARYGYF